jgi:hypothetical protein
MCAGRPGSRAVGRHGDVLPWTFPAVSAYGLVAATLKEPVLPVLGTTKIE